MELLAAVCRALHQLLNRQQTGILLRRDRRYRRQRELHIAGGAGQTTLRVVEAKGMGAGAALSHIIPQVHILAHRAVDAADIAYQPAIQKHPHIIVAEEIVLQRPDVILGQSELHSVLHAEHVVVSDAVIALRVIIYCPGCPYISSSVSGSTCVRVGICDIVHGPEMIRPNFAGIIPVPSAGKGLQTGRGRCPADGRKGVGIAAAVKGKGILPAVIGCFSAGVPVIKQLGCGNAAGILNGSVSAQTSGQAEGTAIVAVSISHIEEVSVPVQLAQPGVGIVVAEGKVRPGASVVGGIVNAPCRCMNAVIGDVIVIEIDGVGISTFSNVKDETDDSPVGNQHRAAVYRLAAVGKVGRGRVINIPISLICAVGIHPIL